MQCSLFGIYSTPFLCTFGGVIIRFLKLILLCQVLRVMYVLTKFISFSLIITSCTLLWISYTGSLKLRARVSLACWQLLISMNTSKLLGTMSIPLFLFLYIISHSCKYFLLCVVILFPNPKKITDFPLPHIISSFFPILANVFHAHFPLLK